MADDIDIVDRLRLGTPAAVYVIAPDAADEIERLRAELIRTAEVIAAQTFDVKTISKTRMKQLVRLSRELLMIADGGQPIRYYHERTITSDTVRQQYPQLRDALASPDVWQEARRER